MLQLVLLIGLLDVELRLELELLALFQHFEVLGRVLDDVRWLVAQHLPGEVVQDLLEAGRHRVLLKVFAGHWQLYKKEAY
jgi:hypothetical protein